ncbi:preprotein translocase subunit SecE [Mycobacterium paragordonae]|uniref:preprotein translocase subunit SecE n=1 Tax=Mycobacterium paragordonae TaxID=1389713 RepID=UPI00106085FD|nr:preprotein translocase subunit SecE [Mycobacterium paragordonae]TDK98661.1 preprotein translocase subunit SecE [Mycobacterium paragordonae]TDL08983.1 preprotein translocase subunit SecE [Mycobacterium paragordonae]
MSDEGDVADDAAGDGGAVVTKASARPQRPTGKRSRVRAVEAEDGDESTDVEVAERDSGKKDASKSAKTSKAKSTQKDKAKKPKKACSPSSLNPFVFVYNYLKQVVAEMRKVIWPNRKQMLTYTSVVLVFLAFMVAVVGGADLGLSKLVLLVFG